MSQPQFTTKQIQQGNSLSYLGRNKKQETTSHRPLLTHQCPGFSATRQADTLDSPDPPPPHPCTLQWVFQSRGGLTWWNALAHTLWNVSSPLAGRVFLQQQRLLRELDLGRRCVGCLFQVLNSFLAYSPSAPEEVGLPAFVILIFRKSSPLQPL